MGSLLSNTETGNITSGLHISYWTESYIQSDEFRRPAKDEYADVVIVGCGIAGASIAYNLIKAGKKVIVLEDGYPGSGETGRTSAHLTTALDSRYYELEKKFGGKKTAVIAHSHIQAINFIEKVTREENIECEFKRNNAYLFLAAGDTIETLEKEYATLNKLGIACEWVDELTSLENYNGPAIQFNDQAIFHPLKYLGGLCKAIEEKGGIIYTGSRVKEIDHDHVITESGINISADHVVVATNSPINNKFVMHVMQFPYRSYIIGALIPKNCIPSMIWWDTGEQNSESEFPPYHYSRIEEYDVTHDLLICGGEDHAVGLPEPEKGNEEKRYKRLEEWARKHFPVTEIAYRWSGQVIYPSDGIANIGRNPFDKNNVYIVTGDCGNGLTYATIAGMLITDLILENKNDWEDIYNPGRAKINSLFRFLKEFTGGLIEYLKSKPETTIKISSIGPGAAAVTEIEGEKVGIYKDVTSQLHIVSAKCTHLGCTIKWNADEKSWDCPCHGSRFTYTGKVLNGPANKELDYFTDPGEIAKQRN